MQVHGYWQHYTRRGVFRIAPVKGRFHVLFEDENLGSYQSPTAALEHLITGGTFLPSRGADPAKVGLPNDLSEWEFIARQCGHCREL